MGPQLDAALGCPGKEAIERLVGRRPRLRLGPFLLGFPPRGRKPAERTVGVCAAFGFAGGKHAAAALADAVVSSASCSAMDGPPGQFDRIVECVFYPHAPAEGDGRDKRTRARPRNAHERTPNARASGPPTPPDNRAAPACSTRESSTVQWPQRSQSTRPLQMNTDRTNDGIVGRPAYRVERMRAEDGRIAEHFLNGSSLASLGMRAPTPWKSPRPMSTEDSAAKGCC